MCGYTVSLPLEEAASRGSRIGLSAHRSNGRRTPAGEPTGRSAYLPDDHTIACGRLVPALRRSEPAFGRDAFPGPEPFVFVVSPAHAGHRRRTKMQVLTKPPSQAELAAARLLVALLTGN